MLFSPLYQRCQTHILGYIQPSLMSEPDQECISSDDRSILKTDVKPPVNISVVPHLVSQFSLWN